MKKIILLFFVTLQLSTIHAQVKIYQTGHINIGFGKESTCVGNQFMDFVVNGPLVGTNQLPVGGYVDNGSQKQSWSDPAQAGGNFATDNSIFGLGADGKLYMVSSTESSTLPSMKWAIQNGPALVKNGVNSRGTSTSKYARSGIGYKKDGTLVVIISLDPVTFREFAEMFVQQNCVNAIYLDGGPYVGYADKSGSYGSLVATATKLQFFNN
jgi:uncharacterized protein YigE (DUF2233 family)